MQYSNWDSQSSQSSSKKTSYMTAEEQWQQQYPGYDYQSYCAAWQNYQSQNAYAYNYDQSYAAYGYSYPQQYAAYTEAQQAAYAAQYASYYETAETAIEEHDIPLDVEQWNQDTILRNDDLYKALDDSRWLPVDNMDPPLIKKDSLPSKDVMDFEEGEISDSDSEDEMKANHIQTVWNVYNASKRKKTKFK